MQIISEASKKLKDGKHKLTEIRFCWYLGFIFHLICIEIIFKIVYINI